VSARHRPAASIYVRQPKPTQQQKREAIRRRNGLGESVREIARSYNVSHSTISRLTTITLEHLALCRANRLYKYFSEKKSAEAFLDGNLLFRSLAYYRDYEDADSW